MAQGKLRYNLNAILEKADQEERLDKGEIVFLLGLRQPGQIDTVFEAARELSQFQCTSSALPSGSI
jgi:hypothetical protein